MEYKLNKNNIKLFIKKSNKEVKNIVKKVIKNTKYISKKVFFKQMDKNIKYLLTLINKDRPIYFFIEKINNYKYKSNYWLYLYFKKYLKKNKINIKIKTINTNNLNILKKDDFVIFIDDCSYSGYQIFDIIYTFTYFFNKNISNINNINLFILLPFISEKGYNYIKSRFKEKNTNKNLKLIFNKYIYKFKSTNNILSKDEFNNINKFYPKVDIINDSINDYFNNKHLIYFFHKLADSQSTITLFYKGLVPNNKNLSILNKIQKDNNKDNFKNIYLKKLDIIPLISNCEKFNKLEDCPYPPYKKNQK